MEKWYTAVGVFKMEERDRQRLPVVYLSGKECHLDIQEMLIWAALNWRILTAEQIEPQYKDLQDEVDIVLSRSFDESLNRLIVRGLVAEGCGDTKFEALYNLLSKLYIVPIPTNAFYRGISFVKLVLFGKVPYEVAKTVFIKDKKSESEKTVLSLANKVTLSTAEIIGCVERGVSEINTMDELLQILYTDRYTTSENIAEISKYSCKCRDVISSISNLYLRKQIIFERL